MFDINQWVFFKQNGKRIIKKGKINENLEWSLHAIVNLIKNNANASKLIDEVGLNQNKP